MEGYASATSLMASITFVRMTTRARTSFRTQAQVEMQNIITVTTSMNTVARVVGPRRLESSAFLVELDVRDTGMSAP